MSPKSPTESIMTPSIFFKLPDCNIRRHGMSPNTNHFVYREINNKPIIKIHVYKQIRKIVFDLYKITEEQHIKRCENSPCGNNKSLVEDMFSLEVVNPEKFRKQQEQERERLEWEREQKDRLKKWKETQLAKQFAEKQTPVKNDLDESEKENRLFYSNPGPETEERIVETPVVNEINQVLTVPKKYDNKIRCYKVIMSLMNHQQVAHNNRVVINKTCCI